MTVADKVLVALGVAVPAWAIYSVLENIARDLHRIAVALERRPAKDPTKCPDFPPLER